MSETQASLDAALAKVRDKKMLSGEEFDALQQALEQRMAERPPPVPAPQGVVSPQVTDPETLVDFECPLTVQGNPFEIQGHQYAGRVTAPFKIYLQLKRMHHGDMENFARLRTPMGNQPGTFKYVRQVMTEPMPFTLHKAKP